MKTTVEIADGLLAAARELAARDGTTLRALIEEGLHHAVERRRSRSGFRLRDVSFRGEGLRVDVREGSWEHLRDRIYEGRGG
ncbi:MAG: DUF2191 domain-containing protein [Acidobacteriota bacterium]|jgi:hypothetical protein